MDYCHGSQWCNSEGPFKVRLGRPYCPVHDPIRKKPPVKFTITGTEHEIPHRDTQRERLYKAEKVLKDHDPELLEELKDTERYVQQVIHSKTFRRLYQWARNTKTIPSRDVEVRDGRGTRTAWASPGMWELNLPKWARSRWIILHEISHLACLHNVGHHWPFASVYLRLVRRFLGREAYEALKQSFRERRVRWLPKAKRRGMSPELRAVLSARMYAINAARRKDA